MVDENYLKESDSSKFLDFDQIENEIKEFKTKQNEIFSFYVKNIDELIGKINKAKNLLEEKKKTENEILKDKNNQNNVDINNGEIKSVVTNMDNNESTDKIKRIESTDDNKTINQNNVIIKELIKDVKSLNITEKINNENKTFYNTLLLSYRGIISLIKQETPEIFKDIHIKKAIILRLILMHFLQKGDFFMYYVLNKEILKNKKKKKKKTYMEENQMYDRTPNGEIINEHILHRGDVGVSRNLNNYMVNPDMLNDKKKNNNNNNNNNINNNNNNNNNYDNNIMDVPHYLDNIPNNKDIVNECESKQINNINSYDYNMNSLKNIEVKNEDAASYINVYNKEDTIKCIIPSNNIYEQNNNKSNSNTFNSVLLNNINPNVGMNDKGLFSRIKKEYLRKIKFSERNEEIIFEHALVEEELFEGYKELHRIMYNLKNYDVSSCIEWYHRCSESTKKKYTKLIYLLHCISYLIYSKEDKEKALHCLRELMLNYKENKSHISRLSTFICIGVDNAFFKNMFSSVHAKVFNYFKRAFNEEGIVVNMKKNKNMIKKDTRQYPNDNMRCNNLVPTKVNIKNEEANKRNVKELNNKKEEDVKQKINSRKRKSSILLYNKDEKNTQKKCTSQKDGIELCSDKNCKNKICSNNKYNKEKSNISRCTTDNDKKCSSSICSKKKKNKIKKRKKNNSLSISYKKINEDICRGRTKSHIKKKDLKNKKGKNEHILKRKIKKKFTNIYNRISKKDPIKVKKNKKKGNHSRNKKKKKNYSYVTFHKEYALNIKMDRSNNIPLIHNNIYKEKYSNLCGTKLYTNHFYETKKNNFLRPLSELYVENNINEIIRKNKMNKDILYDSSCSNYNINNFNLILPNVTLNEDNYGYKNNSRGGVYKEGYNNNKKKKKNNNNNNNDDDEKLNNGWYSHIHNCSKDIITEMIRSKKDDFDIIKENTINMDKDIDDISSYNNLCNIKRADESIYLYELNENEFSPYSYNDSNYITYKILNRTSQFYDHEDTKITNYALHKLYKHYNNNVCTNINYPSSILYNNHPYSYNNYLFCIKNLYHNNNNNNNFCFQNISNFYMENVVNNFQYYMNQNNDNSSYMNHNTFYSLNNSCFIKKANVLKNKLPKCKFLSASPKDEKDVKTIPMSTEQKKDFSLSSHEKKDVLILPQEKKDEEKNTGDNKIAHICGKEECNDMCILKKKKNGKDEEEYYECVNFKDNDVFTNDESTTSSCSYYKSFASCNSYTSSSDGEFSSYSSGEENFKKNMNKVKEQVDIMKEDYLKKNTMNALLNTKNVQANNRAILASKNTRLAKTSIDVSRILLTHALTTRDIYTLQNTLSTNKSNTEFRRICLKWKAKKIKRRSRLKKREKGDEESEDDIKDKGGRNKKGGTRKGKMEVDEGDDEDDDDDDDDEDDDEDDDDEDDDDDDDGEDDDGEDDDDDKSDDFYDDDDDKSDDFYDDDDDKSDDFYDDDDNDDDESDDFYDEHNSYDEEDDYFDEENDYFDEDDDYYDEEDNYYDNDENIHDEQPYNSPNSSSSYDINKKKKHKVASKLKGKRKKKNKKKKKRNICSTNKVNLSDSLECLGLENFIKLTKKNLFIKKSDEKKKSEKGKKKIQKSKKSDNTNEGKNKIDEEKKGKELKENKDNMKSKKKNKIKNMKEVEGSVLNDEKGDMEKTRAEKTQIERSEKSNMTQERNDKKVLANNFQNEVKCEEDIKEQKEIHKVENVKVEENNDDETKIIENKVNELDVNQEVQNINQNDSNMTEKNVSGNIQENKSEEIQDKKLGNIQDNKRENIQDNKRENIQNNESRTIEKKEKTQKLCDKKDEKKKNKDDFDTLCKKDKKGIHYGSYKKNIKKRRYYSNFLYDEKMQMQMKRNKNEGYYNKGNKNKKENLASKEKVKSEKAGFNKKNDSSNSDDEYKKSKGRKGTDKKPNNDKKKFDKSNDDKKKKKEKEVPKNNKEFVKEKKNENDQDKSLKKENEKKVYVHLESPLDILVCAGLISSKKLIEAQAILKENNKRLQEVKNSSFANNSNEKSLEKEKNKNPNENGSLLSNSLAVEVDLSGCFFFHSSFTCPISRDKSSRDNPPYLLTCGHAICKNCVDKIHAQRSRQFKCPMCPQYLHLLEIIPLYFI
ncbi:zinc finger, C3HC4 type, putative [Plasmodium reichenowi]|uniref:Zinc finger, C3HC4 type, putative n=1 Tax=Plasmodium reichenowi TaxID=5854 RepID=A0A151LN32_PLARE|nr:zinc finger, C3HC4 type, putative [Plasmodium reichenowi]KYO00588.1 zinc finger, C3HC4 type, putative [Plasmodium reichenowi]